MNNCSFIGRLVFAPELRHTQSGKAMCKSKIAVNEKRGGEDNPMFLQIVAWERTAEIMAEYTAKGHMVGVEGRLVLNEWEGKDGNKRQQHELMVSRLHLLPGNKPVAESNAQPREEGMHGSLPSDSDDYGDIPF